MFSHMMVTSPSLEQFSREVQFNCQHVRIVVLVRDREKICLTSGTFIFCQLLVSLESPLPSTGQLAVS